jgi:hypothetical protein
VVEAARALVAAIGKGTAADRLVSVRTIKGSSSSDRLGTDGAGGGVGGRLRVEAGGGALEGRQGRGADSEVFLWRLHHQHEIVMPISTTPPTAPPMIGKGDIPPPAPLLVADVPAPLLVMDVQQYQ